MSEPSLIDPRTLGLRIAEARKARSKTQKEVADHIECSRPTYIAIEKGERHASAEEITKIATYLGRKVHELVRSGEPIVDLQPHLRAVAGKLKEKDEQLLLAGIDELQRLAEDYRELEQLMNAPLQFNYPSTIELNNRVDPSELAVSILRNWRSRLPFKSGSDSDSGTSRSRTCAPSWNGMSDFVFFTGLYLQTSPVCMPTRRTSVAAS